MKPFIRLLILLSPFTSFSQQEQIDQLTKSFCAQLQRLENLGDISQEGAITYYQKTREETRALWDSTFKLFDSLYKVELNEFESYFRHQLVLSCKDFREIENYIFNSNPDKPWQQRRFHAIQRFIYSIEDESLDSTTLGLLTGQNKVSIVLEASKELDSLVKLIKHKSILNFHSDSQSMTFGLDLDYVDLISKNIVLKVSVKFNPMNEYEVESITIQNQFELEQERKARRSAESIMPPPPL